MLRVRALLEGVRGLGISKAPHVPGLGQGEQSLATSCRGERCDRLLDVHPAILLSAGRGHKPRRERNRSVLDCAA